MHSLLEIKNKTRDSNLDLREICKPLFDETPIDYFGYIRSNSDGTMLHLATNIDWIDHYIDNKYHEKSVFRKPPKMYAGGIILCDNMIEGKVSEIVNDAICNFNIKNTICLTEKSSDYMEFFQFSSSKSNETILNFYFSIYDVLKMFTFYFKDKAKKLIDYHVQHKILLPRYTIIEKDTEIKNQNLIKKLYQQTNRFYINNGNENVYLSKRETECVRSCAAGKTAKEISIMLGITKKTVDTYMENIKFKLNCTKQSQVLNIVMKNGIIFDEITD